MSTRRLADVYNIRCQKQCLQDVWQMSISFAYLSFKLLLPLDSLPLVGQGIGIWYNNRSGQWRTGGTMMANGEIATPLVLREVASIGEGPCTPRTGNGHIWRTSFRYLADVVKGPLWDVCGMSGRRLCDV